jgi:hypothetical protein
LRTVFHSWIPVVFLAVLYFGIFHEIGLYYGVEHKTNEAALTREWQGVAMLHFYTCVFFAAANFANIRLLKSEQMFYLLTVVTLIALVMQLTLGFWALSQLHNTDHAWMRYLNIAGVALLFYSVWLAKNMFTPDRPVQVMFSIAFNITLLAIICNEYIHWVRMFDSSNEYKLGLSIIFAGYALVMLFRGLIKNISHLRISAIVLFGVAIIKLFAYDLKSMSTIGKTIVLIVLGIILLAASFLYNRFVKKEM